MITSIESPLALARVRWRTFEEGGRRSGPPTAPVYAATCVFPLGQDGQDGEVQPGWPGSADQLSVLLQHADADADADSAYRLYRVGFLAPDLARPFLRPDARMLVLEGPKVVADGIVEAVFGP
jgi:hypothetical protein